MSSQGGSHFPRGPSLSFIKPLLFRSKNSCKPPGLLNVLGQCECNRRAPNILVITYVTITLCYYHFLLIDYYKLGVVGTATEKIYLWTKRLEHIVQCSVQRCSRLLVDKLSHCTLCWCQYSKSSPLPFNLNHSLPVALSEVFLIHLQTYEANMCCWYLL